MQHVASRSLQYSTLFHAAPQSFYKYSEWLAGLVKPLWNLTHDDLIYCYTSMYFYVRMAEFFARSVVHNILTSKTDRSATFWKPTSSINHWISTLTLLPVVWTSTLIFMMPQMSHYSDQVRNRGGEGYFLACKWSLAPVLQRLCHTVSEFLSVCHCLECYVNLFMLLLIVTVDLIKLLLRGGRRQWPVTPVIHLPCLSAAAAAAAAA